MNGLESYRYDDLRNRLWRVASSPKLAFSGCPPILSGRVLFFILLSKTYVHGNAIWRLRKGADRSTPPISSYAQTATVISGEH